MKIRTMTEWPTLRVEIGVAYDWNVSRSYQSNAHLSLMGAAIAEYAIPQAITDCHSTSAADRRCL
jgi:hypothetical protein